MTTRDALEKAAFNYWLLLAVSAVCLLCSLAVGLAAGVAMAFPELAAWVSMRALRPAHTLFALAWLFFGSSAIVGIYAARQGTARLWWSRLQIAFFVAFLLGSLIASARGVTSGREYVTWPAWMAPPLLAGLALTLATVAASWTPLRRHSPEAAWLLLTGCILLPLGLLEEMLYLARAWATDPGRDLMVQWHALDTVIAGWCIILYGVGILLTPAGTRGLRVSWLFVLAIIGILLDFGHHNYPSPQPMAVKLISFSATMLAAVSFVRHMGAFRRSSAAGEMAERPMLRHIEIWTLFAVGTGILMAVPPINAWVHGTLVIVSHTMGSMIGVNSLLIFAAGFAWAGVPSRSRMGMVRATTWSLALFCVALGALGLVRGVVRVDYDFAVWNAYLRPLYLLVPVSALPLTATLAWLGGDLVRCCVRCMRGLEADEMYGGAPAAERGLGEPCEEPAEPAAVP